ncbi:MAG: hypothetical protein U9Q03_04870 [Patescibacteria group bacterium]|nr:hypothetical protein [Patescibacteria group bacterium]
MVKDISSFIRRKFIFSTATSLLLFLLLPVFSARAATPVSGTIPDGTVWNAASSPYTVDSDAIVPAGATLTIESGVTVEFATGTGLTVEGSLNVNGTESAPAVFTSLSATPGSWNGILFDSGSAESTLVHADISYAGAPCSGICRGGITIVTGPIDIISGRVHDSLTYGIVQYDGLVTVAGTEIDHQPYGFSLAHGTATLADNIIHDNDYYGVNANAWEGTLTLTNNTFTANASASARINGGVDLVSASGNISTGSARNGLLMYGFLTHDQTWSADLPYIIEDATHPGGTRFTIPQYHTLAINPGTVVKGEQFSTLQNDGTLVVNGTSAAPVVFTSIHDDTVGGDTNSDGSVTTPAPGDWDGIVFGPNTSGTINYVDIRYAGVVCSPGPCRGGVTLDGTNISLLISDSHVHDSLEYGILQYGGTATVSRTEIDHNLYGYAMAGGNATVTDGSIHDNVHYGALNNSPSGTLTATDNWWGDASGPYHGMLNPDGLGDTVSDNVAFEPWKTVDAQIITVAVILADLADVQHESGPITAQPCKLIEEKTYADGHGREYYEDLLLCVNDYFRENSFGAVNIEPLIMDNAGDWYDLPGYLNDYGVNSPSSRLALVSDTLAVSGIDTTTVDAVLLVHAGDGKEHENQTDLIHSFAAVIHDPDSHFITVAETEPLGVWVHELGHVMKPLMSPDSDLLPDLYRRGDVRAWGVMATASKNDGGSNPASMTAYSRINLGWLTESRYGSGNYPSNVWVESLSSSSFGDEVLRLDLSQAESEYLLIESRTSNEEYGNWDTSLPGIDDNHLVVYYVNDESDVVTIPGNGIVDPLMTANDGLLSPTIHESYNDFSHLVTIKANDLRAVDGQLEIEAVIGEMDAAWFALNLPGVVVGEVLRPLAILQGLTLIINPDGNVVLGTEEEGTLVVEDVYRVEPSGYVLGLLIIELAILVVLLSAVAIVVLTRKNRSEQGKGRIKRLKMVIGVVIGIMVITFVVFGALARFIDDAPFRSAWPFEQIRYAPFVEGSVQPDLDLHVYCDDGRHVGMNYETGEYEAEIDDVIMNGDNQGAPEWIFFPPEGNEGCRHVVSAHDNAEFLAANPDIAAQLPDTSDSYDIYARYIDPASGIYTSTILEAQSVEPDEAVVHAVSGTTDVSIAPGVVDTTAPVTIAEVTGTLAPDGVTYVTPVTVVLTADDGPSGTGVASLLYSTDGGLNWSEYSGSIELTEEGTHTLHFGATDNAGNEEVTQTLEITIDLSSAELSVLFRRHTVGQGNEPGSTKEPVVGATVNAYTKISSSCADTIGYNPHDYSTVLSTCIPDGTGTTGSDGHALMTLDPGEYLLVSEDPQTTVVAGVHSGILANGDTVDKRLNVIVRADGTSVPAKTSKHDGSVLYVIEPEYIEWDDTTELYPFVFDSEGDWGVTVTVEPPEGFVADYENLSTEVNTDYKVLQFTLTDIGSCWECGTGIDIEVTHDGRTEHLRRSIPTPMTEEFVKAKGLDVAEMKARGVRVTDGKIKPARTAPLSLSERYVTLNAWTFLYRLFMPVG